MTTRAELETTKQEITQKIAPLDVALRGGDKEKLRVATVAAYDYFIARYNRLFLLHAQEPTGSTERNTFESMEKLKTVRTKINQGEMSDDELKVEAEDIRGGLISIKQIIERQLRQQMAGRRRKTYRRGRGKRKTQRRRGKVFRSV